MDNVKLCYLVTDSFIVHVKLEGAYEDLAVDVEERFNTSKCKVNRSVPIDKNKRIIG